MTCSYTGARVHFDEYNFTAPADLFTVGDAVIIRWSSLGRVYDTDPIYQQLPSTHNVVVGNGWHREDLGVTVVTRDAFKYGDIERRA